jgi:hypothetical protein
MPIQQAAGLGGNRNDPYAVFMQRSLARPPMTAPVIIVMLIQRRHPRHEECPVETDFGEKDGSIPMAGADVARTALPKSRFMSMKAHGPLRWHSTCFAGGTLAISAHRITSAVNCRRLKSRSCRS